MERTKIHKRISTSSIASVEEDLSMIITMLRKLKKKLYLLNLDSNGSNSLPNKKTIRTLTVDSIAPLRGSNIMPSTNDIKRILSKERNKKYFPLVELLSKIIQTKKNIIHTNLQKTMWSNDIRRLEENSGVEYKRIRRALQWYAENIGGQYIPVIESGSSLREKFLKLEAAMERDSGNFSNETEYKKTTDTVIPRGMIE